MRLGSRGVEGHKKGATHSRDAQVAHGRAKNQGDDDLFVKRMRLTFKQLAIRPYASGMAPSIAKPFQEGSPV